MHSTSRIFQEAGTAYMAVVPCPAQLLQSGLNDVFLEDMKTARPLPNDTRIFRSRMVCQQVTFYHNLGVLLYILLEYLVVHRH